MSAEPEARADSGELLALTTAIFERCGMAGPDAGLLAGSLVAADLRGVHSHGVLRVPEYVARLTRSGVDPRGRPFVASDAGACLVVDGANSMGQIGAHFAMEQAIARAATTGIAAAAVRGSNHCGALAFFAMQALPHDMIGLATTNALPIMAPWGGEERILGINPLAVAIPAEEELPIVYDAAFSHAAHGKIRIYAHRGLSVPEGWALDSQGNPTTDAAAALLGLMQPIGGYKGAALAMIMGIFSSLLSGASYGTELVAQGGGSRPGQDGHFVMAIRVGAFTDAAEFKARVDRVIRETHDCRRAPGVDRIYVPGELEVLAEEEHRRRGIPLPGAVLEGLAGAASGLGIDTAALPWLPGGRRGGTAS
jgi:LDH2 family malate/lactate/ureidoglycolate dehydrogenase